MRDASQSTVKKQGSSAPKLITYKIRQGGRVRDIGTHIPYKGDGKSLSLMEIDILRTTGCKWSKVIYPGFKGYLKPHEKQEIYKATDQYEMDASLLVENKDVSAALSPKSIKEDSLISSFTKEFSKIVDGSGLRNCKEETNPFQNEAITS